MVRDKGEVDLGSFLEGSEKKRGTRGRSSIDPTQYLDKKPQRSLKGLRLKQETIERVEYLAQASNRSQSEIVDAAVAFFHAHMPTE